MSNQVTTSQVRTGEVSSGHFMSWGQVRLGQVRLSQVRPDQVRSSQVRSGQDMPGQVMSVPWVHIYIFYLEPMTPLKQFLPGFRFMMDFLISILASSCRFLSFSNCLEPGGIASHFVHPCSGQSPTCYPSQVGSHVQEAR